MKKRGCGHQPYLILMLQKEERRRKKDGLPMVVRKRAADAGGGLSRVLHYYQSSSTPACSYCLLSLKHLGPFSPLTKIETGALVSCCMPFCIVFSSQTMSQSVDHGVFLHMLLMKPPASVSTMILKSRY